MKLPERITIAEVGPRDGLQNLPDSVPTEIKLTLIEKLIAAGIKNIELTAFVHPKAIPRLADSADVASAITEKYRGDASLLFYALVPNVRGAENAARCGINTISVVISVSEAHNRANVNRTVAESIAGLKDITGAFPDMNVRLDAATAFGCPFEGDIPFERVLSLIDKGAALGVREAVLCDTIGIADPMRTEALIALVRSEFPELKFAVHLHDTRGTGLANSLVAMQCGITEFETSIGGLGGCPFAPGAAGNTATEDLWNMTERMGVNTGLAGEKLFEALDFVRDHIKGDLASRMCKVNAAACRP
ncbi:MAG: hydroxymethylglutaryl-CoA lyase [Clostridiales Family XIII bacterium]|jgi:hydroxymethylglutaryl-CoA lyase|nr:hydroxymethylglutaryl-CoA lyase [Clostridiales Family XIII bacterium]